MRRIQDELLELRVPPEQLARWSLETKLPAQEATFGVLAFLARVEHAAASLLPVPALALQQTALQDPDGFLRVPRGALEQFRNRGRRALAWLEQLVFFRERFPQASREPDAALFGLARAFTHHDDDLEAAVDSLVREAVMPEIEETLVRAVKYPPLQALLRGLRETDPQRSADARRMAATVLGELSGVRVWRVRRRLITTATRAVLGAKPLFDVLEHGGLQVDRARAAKGFARRLEEAVGELSGTPVVPPAIIARLAGLGPEDGAAEELPVDEPPPEV